MPGRGVKAAKPQSFAGLGLRTSKRYDSYMSSTAPEPPAPPATQLTLPCTGCVIDVKQGLALGRDRAELPDPLPGTVMVNGMLLCDVRHQLNVGAPPPALLIAGADALPNRMLA
jgi:hypothetical protein